MSIDATHFRINMPGHEPSSHEEVQDMPDLLPISGLEVILRLPGFVCILRY